MINPPNMNRGMRERKIVLIVKASVFREPGSMQTAQACAVPTYANTLRAIGVAHRATDLDFEGRCHT
jgi:hypothetical protein